MHRGSWLLAERLLQPFIYGQIRARGAGAFREVLEGRIDYGEDPAQHVLLTRPRSGASEDILVYYLHGGSWRSGSPDQYRAVGRFFAAHGYTAALGGYRLAPGATFPAQLHDVLDGLRTTLARLEESGMEAPKVVLAGHSAGGHLAALVALDEETRQERGLGDAPIAGVIPISGVLDLQMMCPDRSKCSVINDFVGSEEGWKRADPARFLRGGPQIPTLCLHGSRDPLVPVEVAASFVLRANRSRHEQAALITDPQGHHADLLRVFLGASPLTSVLLEWLGGVAGER